MTDNVVIHAVDGSGARLIEYNGHVIGTISPEGVYHGAPLTGVANADGTMTIMYNGEQIGTITTPDTADSTPIQPGDVITISPPSDTSIPGSNALIYFLRRLYGIFEGPLKPEQPDNNTPVDGGKRGAIEKYLQDIGDLLLPAKANASEFPVISSTLGTTPDPLLKVIKYVPYSDPLILDLDGDGLEITPLSKAILFDTNGDTIKAGTAWAGADDGLVVWDRNGNGLIDSGRELFGDEMILADGNKAAHGFAALKDLDTGSVINGRTVGANDNVFDANDSAYANLRLWNDLNQDGISQANELTTLSDAGVHSINLVSTSTQTKYTDALLIEDGHFTRTGGSTGQAGSFILAQNYFVRAFSPIAVSDAAKALPNFKGTGWVRDLQEAATINPDLIALVNQTESASTRRLSENSHKNKITHIPYRPIFIK